jgi:hypothetical protein
LTRQREAQIKGYFHRHGFKILVSGRFVPGFRTAAYLTAGLLKLPTLKLLLTDLVAASLTTFLMFGLGYAFANQIQSGIREVQQWVTVIVAAGVAIWLLIRYDKARRRAGQPVGPPVLDSDDVPLPARDRRGALPPERAAALTEPTSSDIATSPPDSSGHADPAAAIEVSIDAQPRPPHADSQPQTPPLPRHAHNAVVLDLEAGQPHSSVESPSR